MSKIGGYNIRAAGVPWVRAEDWLAFLAIMEDRDDSPVSWEIFNQRSEQFESSLKAQGYIVVRAYIDPETFPDWCRTHGHRVNAEGRGSFAASVAAEKHGRNNS